MNIKLLDDVSFIDTGKGMPVLKRGRVIQIFNNTIDQYDVRAEKELPQQVNQTAVIQESEIRQDEKDKDYIFYTTRSHNKPFNEVFASDSDVKQYIRDLFVD